MLFRRWSKLLRSVCDLWSFLCVGQTVNVVWKMAKVVERCWWLMIRVEKWSDDVICCLRVGWSCRVMFMRGELCFEESWCSGEVFMVNDKCCVTLGRRWMMFECKVKQVIDDYVSTESERAWIFRVTHPNFFLFLISDFIIYRTYS